MGSDWSSTASFFGDHNSSLGHCFIVLECVYNDVDEVGLAGMQQQQSLVGETVTRCIKVVLDGAGSDGCAGNGVPLDEQDGIASEEIVLQCWVGEVYTWVVDVDALTEGKKVFLSGQGSFCRLGSLGSGDFASNSASKIVETSSALDWKSLHCCSCGRARK